MANNQSKTPEQGNNEDTSNGTPATEPSYSDIMAAVESGDASALDRLMAVEKEEEEEKDSSAVDETDDENTDDSTDTDEGEGSQPAEKSDENPVEAANKTAASTAQPQPANDELAQMKQELHRLRSELGRVGPLQRTVQQLQEELRAARARTSATDTDNPGTENKSKKPPIPDTLKAKLDHLRQIDPDLADIMLELHEATTQTALNSDQDVLGKMEEQRAQAEAERFYTEQKAILAEIFPKHEEIFALPEWAQWKESLSPGMRAMAESGYANEVAQAIYAFAQVMQAQQNPSQSSTSSGGGDPNASTKVDTADSSVVEQRNRKVGGAPNVRNPAAKHTENFDPDAYFHETYQRLAKERGIVK